MMPIGLEHSLPKGAFGPTFRRDVIATSPSVSARTSTVRATWSNGSSIGSNSVGGSRRATTNSQPTTWPSFNSHQYGCGFVLMSPRPQAKRPFRNWLSGVQLSNMRDLTFQNPTSKIPKSVMPIEAAPRLNNACEWSPRFYLFFANDRYPLPKRECVV